MSIATAPRMTNRQFTEEFDRTFREYYRFVYRTAYSMTGSSADAEDILQTLFLRLLERELPPDLKTNPKPYLYRAAVNLSLNAIRLRRRHVLTGDAERLDSPAPHDDANAAEEIQRRLLAAVAQLEPKAVEILVLRYVHDYSDAQIAKLLGTSRGTIAVSLFRSRARLKKLMRATQE
jgi:RNA polymerase sigma-70 factor (ECF subfamily)